MESNPSPFHVKDCALLAIATGLRAFTLEEFRETLRDLPIDSVYYHFWGGLLQPRFEEREFNNDFAAWARHGLHDGKLAERLAVLDPRGYPELEPLRQELIELVDERLDEDAWLHWVRATQPFEFMRAQIVVFHTGRRVTTPKELAAIIPALAVGSIFYHFVDARRRVPEAGDDFRAWLAPFGEAGRRLRERLAAIDPYFVPLSVLREQLATVCSEALGGTDAAR